MSAPVRHTCPDIDKLIKNVKLCLSLKQDLSSEDLVDEIYYYLSDFEDELEKLRKANDELRRWGEEQEEIASELYKRTIITLNDEY